MPNQSASIALRAGSDTRLGGYVSFITSYPNKVKLPYIQLLAYNSANVVVWAFSGVPSQSFLLGGTVSPWLDHPEPVTIIASLYYWAPNQKQVILAETSFSAGI